VLEFYLYQLNWHGWLVLVLEFLVCYNVYQLLRQVQLVYFLLYQLLFIVYAGILLVYFGLDIFAFILWIVYGSFIAVVFILSFVWVDTTYFRFAAVTQARLGWALAVVLCLVGGSFMGLAGVDVDYYFSFFELGWVNYYELLA
jgi:hypothetical protein